MNLIIFSQFFYPKSGGAYSYLKNILDNLSPDEYKQVYLVIRKSDFKDLNIENNGLNILPVFNEIPGPRTISFLLFSIFFHKKISSLYDSSVKNIIWNPYNWGIVRRIKGFTTVTTIHDLHTFTYPKDKGVLKSYIYSYLLKITVKKTDRIIAVSNYTKQEIYAHLKSYISDKPIKVIYESYKPLESVISDRLFARNYLFTVSSYRKQKNLEFLLRVYKDLKERYSYNGDLLVGGNISEKNKLKLVNECKKLGISDNVIFAGFINDSELHNYFKYCDCFVFPSYYEGFGLPVVEANACGSKICTSDAASLNEFNTTEFKANPFDLKGFSEMIIKAISSDYIPIHFKYSWLNAANETSELFKN
jgi:glycosyltransferase involved in cell wall biosynthesis